LLFIFRLCFFTFTFIFALRKLVNNQKYMGKYRAGVLFGEELEALY